MKYFIFIFLCFLLSSCVTPVELHNNELSPTLVMKKKWEKTIPTFFFGLIASSKNVTTWDKCQQDKYSLKIGRTFSHIIAAFFTLGIYTPLKVTIICYGEQVSATENEVNEFETFDQDSFIDENKN